MIGNMSMTVHAFVMYMLTLLSVEEILLPNYVNWSTNFRGLPLKSAISPSRLKHMNTFFIFIYVETNTPGYAVGILLRQVYLKEALDHLRSLH